MLGKYGEQYVKSTLEILEVRMDKPLTLILRGKIAHNDVDAGLPTSALLSFCNNQRDGVASIFLLTGKKRSSHVGSFQSYKLPRTFSITE